MEPNRNEWERPGPRFGLAMLRGMCEGVVLWIAVTLALELFQGVEPGALLSQFWFGFLLFQPLHLLYILPLAVFLYLGGNPGRALGLFLQWALGLLLVLSYCSRN